MALTAPPKHEPLLKHVVGEHEAAAGGIAGACRPTKALCESLGGSLSCCWARSRFWRRASRPPCPVPRGALMRSLVPPI